MLKKSLVALLGIAVLTSSLLALPPTPPPTNKSANAGSVLTLDTAAVFNDYWKMQDAQKKLQESEEKANQELKDMYDAGVALAAEVQELIGKSNNPALTEDARKKFSDEAKAKQAVVQQKEVEFSQYQQQISRTLSQQQEALLKNFADDVKVVAESIRQERGAPAVFNASGPLVVASDPGLDITKTVTERLNASKPKTSSTAKDTAKSDKK